MGIHITLLCHRMGWASGPKHTGQTCARELPTCSILLHARHKPDINFSGSVYYSGARRTCALESSQSYTTWTRACIMLTIGVHRTSFAMKSTLANEPNKNGFNNTCRTVHRQNVAGWGTYCHCSPISRVGPVKSYNQKASMDS